MQLIQIIEKAIRSNCNVSPYFSNARKKLTSALAEEDPQFPRIMFVGLCHQHGIGFTEIQDYLCLTKPQVEKKITEFGELIDQGQQHYQARQNNQPYDDQNSGYRFLVQTNMCNGYISEKAAPYVELAEIVKY